jgi:iron complex transport system ATP-binding protein
LPVPLFDLHNVSVRRGDRLALKNITVAIAPGEHVAILGPNGSGKSSLLKLLQRECYPLREPDMRLRIMGHDNWNIFALREQLGIVSNDLMTQCTRDITGGELVLSGFFGSIGIPPNAKITAQHRHIARQAMEKLGVLALSNRWTDELSSGESRRLLIARALIHNPRTLVLDEPTTSLDLGAQREMHETMRSLAQGGIGLLLVTHHLEEIIPEIDRVVLLQDGAIVADGPKSQVLTSESLSQLFQIPLTLRTDGGIFRAF